MEGSEEAPSCHDEQSAMSKRCREKLARERNGKALRHGLRHEKHRCRGMTSASERAGERKMAKHAYRKHEGVVTVYEPLSRTAYKQRHGNVPLRASLLSFRSFSLRTYG